MNKAVFMDRDGVINFDPNRYTYKLEEFVLLEGVPEALQLLKNAGYYLVIITNQAGIAKKIYGHEEVKACHQKMHELTDNAIDGVYYSPYHPQATQSLGRKPGSLLFEKAMAKFDVDPTQSYMFGDKERDLVPAVTFGFKTIQVFSVHEPTSKVADYQVKSLLEGAKKIVSGEF